MEEGPHFFARSAPFLQRKDFGCELERRGEDGEKEALFSGGDSFPFSRALETFSLYAGGGGKRDTRDRRGNSSKSFF